MTDKFSPSDRSSMMSKVGQKNTKPEVQVRSLLHKLGFRFTLHDKKLPGTPDIVLPKYKTAIFVHGCFWHQHEGCRRGRRPTSNIEFWNKKLNKNIIRDKSNLQKLRALCWKPIIVWQCELKDKESLSYRLQNTIVS